MRDTAPAGLLGPAQLELPPDAPNAERWVAEAYYAQREKLGFPALKHAHKNPEVA